VCGSSLKNLKKTKNVVLIAPTQKGGAVTSFVGCFKNVGRQCLDRFNGPIFLNELALRKITGECSEPKIEQMSKIYA